MGVFRASKAIDTMLPSSEIITLKPNTIIMVEIGTDITDNKILKPSLKYRLIK